MTEQYPFSTPKYECSRCGMKFYTDMLVSCPKCFAKLTSYKGKKIPLKLC